VALLLQQSRPSSFTTSTSTSAAGLCLSSPSHLARAAHASPAPASALASQSQLPGARRGFRATRITGARPGHPGGGVGGGGKPCLTPPSLPRASTPFSAAAADADAAHASGEEEAAAAEAGDGDAALDLLSVEALKTLLRSRGAKVGGRKSELLMRLRATGGAEGARAPGAMGAGAGAIAGERSRGRGLHYFTFQLNVSFLYEIGDAFRG
jgi:hypothetical protein